MSFGLSAAAWAIGAYTAVTAYSSDQQRKGVHAQLDAQNAAQAAEVEQKAQAEANANATLANTKRRRRSAQGLLASGSDAPLGTSVLGSASDAQPRSQIASPRVNTTLGGP